MSGLEPVGRTILILGIALVAVGLVLVMAPKIPFLGRLPGDIRLERDGMTIFIPLGSMILVSVLVSVVASLIGRNR